MVATLYLCIFLVLILGTVGRLVAEGEDFGYEVSDLELCGHIEAGPATGEKMCEDLTVLELVG
jgi:hypothetical protein